MPQREQNPNAGNSLDSLQTENQRLREALAGALWAWEVRRSIDPGHIQRRATQIMRARLVLEECDG